MRLCKEFVLKRLLRRQESHSSRCRHQRARCHQRILKRFVVALYESRIVLNTVRGFTVDQSFVRSYTNNKAQVFAVDTWRLEDIANSLYEGDEQAQHKALHSELVYTLGVAAVLTDGKLPVDLIKESKALVTV